MTDDDPTSDALSPRRRHGRAACWRRPGGRCRPRRTSVARLDATLADLVAEPRRADGARPSRPGDAAPTGRPASLDLAARRAAGRQALLAAAAVVVGRLRRGRRPSPADAGDSASAGDAAGARRRTGDECEPQRSGADADGVRPRRGREAPAAPVRRRRATALEQPGGASSDVRASFEVRPVRRADAARPPGRGPRTRAGGARQPVRPRAAPAKDRLVAVRYDRRTRLRRLVDGPGRRTGW